jgi:hypothetical protein
MVNSDFVTNQEVDRCINQSWAQLYDRLLATGEDYYIKYVDIPPQGSTSTVNSAATLLSVGMSTFSLAPVEIAGNGWSIAPGGVVAFSLSNGYLQGYLDFSFPINVASKFDYDGTYIVLANSNNESIVGVNPVLPTPTVAFQTTSWSPSLSINESIGSDSGVLYDTATGEYLTLIQDQTAQTCRVVRFTIVGVVATEQATTAPMSYTSPTDLPSLLYVRPGFVAVAVDGVFYEMNTTTLATTTTISGIAPAVSAGVYDATTQRALVSADVSSPTKYYALDVAGSSLIGTLDAAITAVAGSVGTSIPTRTPDGNWLVSNLQGLTIAGAPAVVQVDPATLACSVVASVPSSNGVWAYKASTGVLFAMRMTSPLLGLDDAAIYAFAPNTITSTDFSDFQDFTSSNGQPATDVYQVRGVDAVYSGNSVVNLPRFNWEERNIYNATPALTPYFPIVAYRVIQNPITGNDCIEFIPSTSSGASYYRVWYYPNPKVLTLDTDTIDGRSGWEEWVVIDAAMKLLAKEESDTSQLEREAQRVWARIMNVVENRDAGQGKRITDVSFNSGMWPYSSSYPRRY